ncbi:MAG TPA: hypothetical protein VMM55_08810 [Thermohalobaculum sp.]|nr:hypothetical protein [Thermohalobaculum sp.]
MAVIPFNPGGTGRDTRVLRKDAPDGGVPECRMGEAGDPPAPAADSARAARLEHALIEALRESAANWARAERAERTLGERGAAPPDDRADRRRPAGSCGPPRPSLR